MLRIISFLCIIVSIAAMVMSWAISVKQDYAMRKFFDRTEIVRSLIFNYNNNAFENMNVLWYSSYDLDYIHLCLNYPDNYLKQGQDIKNIIVGSFKDIFNKRDFNYHLYKEIKKDESIEMLNINIEVIEKKKSGYIKN